MMQFIVANPRIRALLNFSAFFLVYDGHVEMYYLSWKKLLFCYVCMFVSHLFYDSLDSSKTQLSWTFVIVIKIFRFNVCSLNVHCNFLSHLRRWLILHLKFLDNLPLDLCFIHTLRIKESLSFSFITIIIIFIVILFNLNILCCGNCL